MNFCHDCVYCSYHDFDDGWISFYICDKHEDKDDIEFDTVACDDFESKKGRKDLF